jgi:hypothetical protein
MEASIGDFLSDGYFSGEQAELVSDGVVALLGAVRPDAVALVEAFGFDDELELHNTAIGDEGEGGERGERGEGGREGRDRAAQHRHRHLCEGGRPAVSSHGCLVSVCSDRYWLLRIPAGRTHGRAE